jgi:hypothetical protein
MEIFAFSKNSKLSLTTLGAVLQRKSFGNEPKSADSVSIKRVSYATSEHFLDFLVSFVVFDPIPQRTVDARSPVS